MNKKVNTIVFIVAGTIVNLLLAILFIVLLMVLIFKVETIWSAVENPCSLLLLSRVFFLRW